MIMVNHQPISTMSLSATSASSLKASGDGDYHFHGQPVECFFFFPIKITLDGKSSAVLFERANSKLQTTIFHCSVHCQLCVFTNTEQKPTRCAHSYLHQCRCPAVATAEMHLSLCWHALFGFHSCLAGVGGIFFPAWRNSFPHLSFLCASMSNTLLAGCPSAAVYHTATKCNGIQEGSTIYKGRLEGDSTLPYSASSPFLMQAGMQLAFLAASLCYWLMQFFIHQDPWVFLCRAALHEFSS